MSDTDLVRQTSEAGQEMRPRSEIRADELLREVGAVLRMSETEAAELAARSKDPAARADVDDVAHGATSCSGVDAVARAAKSRLNCTGISPCS